MFSPEGLGHDAHHLSLCIRETLLVSFRIGGYLALRLNWSHISLLHLADSLTNFCSITMSFVCTLSNDPCAAIHVLHLGRWILVRLVGHFRSRTRGYPRDYNMSMTCGLVWLLFETCCQPNGLTHQCGLFAPSVDSRPCSSTQWLLDVANPLVARLHHLNLVRWSCDSIASSTWLSTSSSVWFSTAFSSSFCWFSSANWSHQHQLLFDTTLQLGNFPSPSSWWRCTALISSLISVCQAEASSCSLPLTSSGKVLAHLPPSSSSHHFSQTPHQNPDKSEFQLLIFFACACSPQSHQNCVSPDCSFVPHSNLLTAITDSRHCLLLALLFLHGFLGSDPGCFFLHGFLGSDPGSFSLDHHSNLHHWLQHEILVVHCSSQLLTCTV